MPRRPPDKAVKQVRLACGAAIARWREKAKLSQEALASHLRVSLRTVQRWELGRGSPQIEHLVAMDRLHDGATKQIFHSARKTCA